METGLLGLSGLSIAAGIAVTSDAFRQIRDHGNDINKSAKLLMGISLTAAGLIYAALNISEPPSSTGFTALPLASNLPICTSDMVSRIVGNMSDGSPVKAFANVMVCDNYLPWKDFENAYFNSENTLDQGVAWGLNPKGEFSAVIKYRCKYEDPITRTDIVSNVGSQMITQSLHDLSIYMSEAPAFSALKGVPACWLDPDKLGKLELVKFLNGEPIIARKTVVMGQDSSLVTVPVMMELVKSK